MPKTTLPVGTKRNKDDDSSYLVDETTSMDRNRREMEQQGLRVLLQARVNERDHAMDEPEQAAGMGQDFGSDLRNHPLLDSQLLDGIEGKNPADPNLDPAAQRKIKSKQEDQKRDKELRLEKKNELQYANTPRFNPKPGGP
ncbi:MAG: hypothetical protein NTW08_08180 [Gammaproteobacteria bacterium]|nr:hypothetical protein [Gammaproteobacteria bacterium]